MNIGIIGSSTVAQTLGEKLLSVGHAVMISARDPDVPKDLGPRGVVPAAGVWATTNFDLGREAAAGTFAEAAAFGELLVNATAGAVSLAALDAADRADIEGKILLDLSNPLDFSRGMPPGLAFCNYDSLGERLQAAYPGARVVKTLNTVNVGVMVDPAGSARRPTCSSPATTPTPRPGCGRTCSRAGPAGPGSSTWAT